jgi:two-component system phosphate regulon sensor histidine kinase PhoR
MKAKSFRFFFGVMLTALVVLLAIQVYWFVNSFALHEKQFDERVNLALRSVADQILKSEGDFNSAIKPVKQTASNAYFVEVNHFLDYRLLDSIVKQQFTRHDIKVAFSLMLFNSKDSLVLGNFFLPETANQNNTGSCVGRDQKEAAMNFSVTFPDKPSFITKSLDIWIFSASTFILILVLCLFLIIEILKRKKFAELKNEFINNMTHELQTPIANISLASEILISQPDIQNRSRYLNIIREENQRLKKQVELVLQIALMDTGHVSLEKQRVDLHSIIREVIHNFELRIQSREGKIQTALGASDAVIKGDAFHIKNVFQNLIDNASKYSLQSPLITISSAETEKGLMISVADAGIGISEEDQAHVFDKFFRASHGDVHNVKGFGLGLTYVRNIVHAHKGAITLQSELNKGSRFDLFFPRAFS